MEQHLTLRDVKQTLLPFFGNRAFLGQQRTRAELERDLAELGIVDPVAPVAQVPHAAGHHDRHVVGNAALTHRRAQLADARERVLRHQRILGVRQSVVSASQPRILVHDRRQPLRCLGIGALPQRAEGTTGADDRQVVDAVGCGDLRQLVRHAGTTGDSGDQTLGPLQHAVQHALRATHFPQHVDVDRTRPARDLPRAMDLLHGAVDRVLDQLLVPLAPGQRAIDLGDDLALGIIAVGVHRRHGADAARRCPGARRRMVGCRDALAPLDQRPDLAAVIIDWSQALEHVVVTPGAVTSRKAKGCATRALTRISRQPRTPGLPIASSYTAL